MELTQTEEDRALVEPEVSEYLIDDLHLLLPARVSGVDDVQEEIGLDRLLERRAERGDEMVRQLADESDRVRQQRPQAISNVDLACEGVECREQSILDIDLVRARQSPEDR
jgi:hypothetical protein